MEVKKILLIFLMIVLFFILTRYVTKSNNLTNLTSAETSQTISSDLLSGGETSTNFTYSIWFYIEDWNYKYGDKKILFTRSSANSKCPHIYFTPSINNLAVEVTVYPSVVNTSNSNASTLFTCGIPNVPIQKWCNFLITSYGRTLDLYLDGKLVKTCVLPGVPKIDSGTSVYVTPNGGFSGWTSKFKYWSDSTNPQKAWDIYKEGFGGNWLGNLFGRYSIKVSVVEDGTEETTVTI